ncbi:MAG: septal ring lytic transglycosylase RlpA family protein [Syntrophotaleaceae bacterium]
MSIRGLQQCLVLSAGCFLLAACAGGYKTRIIDTPESRHLKGHQRPYSINGKRYDPVLSSDGFQEQGMASWYGRKFHGKKTSNGEIYDMHAMTAAHKTLPMGTLVRVTNVLNGREVTVRINDRGPFTKGRVIDVSYAAAKLLGLVGPGTAPVRIEALEGSPVNPASLEGARGYVIQLGSFSLEENARRLAKRLEKQTGTASIVQERVGSSLYFRVMAGRYSTFDAAQTARNRLEKEGYSDCFVVAKD